MKTRNQLPSVSADSAQLILRRADLPAIIGLSLPTIDRLRARADFAPAIRLGQQAIGFRRSDIEKWLATRPEVTQ